ncbi:hypothetical protein Tco_1285964 [Tanacetum coccineum]
MENKNPFRTLGDYSRPGYEGYRNTIELPDGNSVVPVRTINQSAGGKLLVKNAEEFWALLEDLALYDNEIWNDPRDFAKMVKAISLPQDVPSTSDHRLIELENQLQHLMEAYLAPNPPVQVNKIASSYEAGGKWYTFKPKQNNLGDTYNPSWKSHPNLSLDKYVESLELGKNRSALIQGKMPKKMKDPGLFPLPCSLGDSKPFDTLADLGSCVNLIPFYLFKKLKIGLLEETDHVLGWQMELNLDKDPATSLLVGRGFLATANVVIDCKKTKIGVEEGVTRSIFGVKEIDLGEEEVPYWTTLGKRELYTPRASTDGIGTDISQKDEKPSKKRQNQTRDGKVCEDEAQSKSRADYANLGNFIYKRKKGEKENEKKKDVEGLFLYTNQTYP